MQHLNLAACSIADAGCQALMVAIGEYKAMKTLDLSCNAIGDDAAGSVSEVLAQKDCELEKLCLSMNCMSSYGISKLMEGVAENLDGSLREVEKWMSPPRSPTMPRPASMRKSGAEVARR